MAIEDRGFASMDRNRQREIASQGGKEAHRQGRAHRWTKEEAQAAGRKGGRASAPGMKQKRQIWFPLAEIDALIVVARFGLHPSTVDVDLDHLRSALARLEAAKARVA